MPFDPVEFYEHATGSADPEGRMPLSRMTGWEIFPFESDGLQVVRLKPPQLPEPDRNGERGVDCGGCQRLSGQIWSSEHWSLRVFPEPGGAPLLVMLQPKAHFDLVDLPDPLAEEFGRLVVHIARAIEALPHIARAHVSRWGDGGAHLHVFFYARPEGFPQLRGTCLAIWDDLLPQTPIALRDADAEAVVVRLVRSFGGTAEVS